MSVGLPGDVVLPDANIDLDKDSPVISGDLLPVPSPVQPSADGSGESAVDKTIRVMESATSSGSTDSTARTIRFSINNILGGISLARKNRSDGDSPPKNDGDVEDHRTTETPEYLKSSSSSEKMAALYHRWTHPYFYREFHLISVVMFCRLIVLTRTHFASIHPHLFN